MEKSVIRAFKRLRVLTPNLEFRANMDELVNDLSHALEESSHQTRVSSGRSRRRRGRKRRSKVVATGSGSMCNGELMHHACFISEDSESSLDFSSLSYQYCSKEKDPVPGDSERYSLVPSTMSDTDELTLNIRNRQGVSIPGTSCNNFGQPQRSAVAASFGESDSVNENFSPAKPHRRRRKFKRMAIDCEPFDEKCKIVSNDIFKTATDGSVFSEASASNSNFLKFTCGKRKRCSRERSVEMMENNCESGTSLEVQEADPAHEQISYNNESSMSSLSSSESDIDFYAHDEGREADDEQSDFFFEPGPTCGIPGATPWWTYGREESEDADAKFEQLFRGCYDHMSAMAKNSYHFNIQRSNNKRGREIKTGHRRLDSFRRPFSAVTSIETTISEFLQDPNQNELCLPPLSKAEKKQLLNLASNFSLKIKCDNKGTRKHAFLLKTPRTNQVVRTELSECMNTDINFAPKTILGEVKRRRKTPPDSPAPLTDADKIVNPVPECNISNQILRMISCQTGAGLSREATGHISPVTAIVRPKSQSFGHSSSMDVS